MSEYIFVTNIFEYSNIFVTLCSGVQLWPPMVLLLTLVFYCAPVVSPLSKYIATLVCTVVVWYYCGVYTGLSTVLL